MKQFVRVCTFAFSFLFFFLHNGNAQQTARYVSMAATTRAYYEYLPDDYYSGSQTYPLLIFIHGLGELGTGSSGSLPAVLRNGVPRLINEGSFPESFTVNGQTHKFIVISPQFVSWPVALDINTMIDYLVSHYRVNTSRIYLTGLSMGGGVTWDYAGNNINYAKRLAAIVPVCGANWPYLGRGLNIGNADLPVWATHNQDDPQVPVFYTNDYVKNINSVNPTPLARKTIFNSGGHDAWSTTYNPGFRENNMNVYEWMLQYQRGGGTPANRAPVANAGADRAITLPANSVTLAGSGSDADGTITDYTWTKVGGPSQYTISNNDISNPVVSNLTEGTYTFRLTVTDNLSATGYNDMVVTVNPASESSDGKTIPGRIEAEVYDAMYGIASQLTRDLGGGYNLTWVQYHDWMDYEVNVTTAGTYTVNLRIASYANNAQLQLLNGSTVLTTVDVPNTGGYQNWRTISTTVYLEEGTQKIRVYSSDYGGWTLNWMDFVETATGVNSSIERSGITNVDGGAGVQSQAQDAGIPGKSSFRMFPMPVTNAFTLQLNNNYSGQMKIQIVDLSGGVRKEFNVAKNQPFLQYNISADGLAAGTYFVRVQMGAKQNSWKMVKL